jgi:hypothetical protein
VFVAGPPGGPTQHRTLRLLRAAHATFTGPAQFLADAAKRARVAEYLTDMAAPYGYEVPAALFRDPPSAQLGHSYGEMAEALIGQVVPADEPVGLLILAFSVHDLRPGRHTAAYLSHVTPGAPIALAVCDQGSAAAFSGLRIAREYAGSAGIGRVLVIVAEQAALPYASTADASTVHASTVHAGTVHASTGLLPARHQAVAMLYGDGATEQPGLGDVRQHAGVAASRVADLAAADFAELTAGRPAAGLVISAALAERWEPPAPRSGHAWLRVAPQGQPSSGIWSELAQQVTAEAGRPELTVVADYDPQLGYLCLASFDRTASLVSLPR